MGAISFSLDSVLVKYLKKSLPLDVLVETGTFHGDTVAMFASTFKKVFSIELSDELWGNAIKRFKYYQNISIMHGNSPDNLRQIKPELDKIGVIYWLDAHWCAANATAGELSQCPLIEELQAIGKLNSDSVLLIDDARLFLAPPLAPHEISQWPNFHQIIIQLLSMSDDHELMVVNDVIAYFPSRASEVMQSYAQEHGTDWLLAANCKKENGTFLHQLVEKENVIQQQQSAIQKQQNVIQEQSRVLRNYHQAFKLFRPILPMFRLTKSIVKRCISVLRPRLGNLNQYFPRPLEVIVQRSNIYQTIRTPKVSIVTPSFQQGDFIEYTLRSVLDQQYPNLEYFIQDGGSDDGTINLLHQYDKKLSGWESQKDNGQSHAINCGFVKTSGEIMAWLNSDDLLLPNSLALVVDYFNKHPDVDVVYGNRLLIDEKGMEIGRWILPGHDSEILSWADYIPQETMFWRRSIWEKVGSHIDESFRFAMDWDLIVRFREAGAKFAHIPHFLGAFRIHEQQKTSAAINEIGHQEMNRIRQRLLGEMPSRKQICKKIFPFLLKHILVDIAYRIKDRFKTKISDKILINLNKKQG